MTWPGGGNVNPLVALGARLVERGHTVRIAGLAAVPDFAETGSGSADVIVVDYMLPFDLCRAEATGTPYVAFVHTLYTRQAITDRSPMHMGGDLAAVNQLRAELGLDPVARVPDLLDRADVVLVVTVRELDRPRDIPANVRFVGPLVEDPGAEVGWRPPRGDGPLVVVGLGTTPMDEAPVLQRVLDALGAHSVRVFATVGDHLDPSAIAAPGNTVVSRYVRHAAVMPHADVFVTHAGLSGIGAALTFGVPMVCLPLGREQPDNAAAVQASGAGTVVALNGDVGAAVTEVLRDARYRDAAGRIAASIRPDEAVGLVEALLP